MDAPPPTPTGAGWTAPPQPSGPAPGVAFAPHGARLVAYIIDGIIVAVVMTAGALVAVGPVVVVYGSDGSGTGSGLAALATIALFLLTTLVGLLYFPWFWVRSGRTPGMRLFHLRVVRDRDGGPISWGTALLRLIGYWVSAFVFYIGFVWILFDERRRGWHDLIAGTVVIEEPG
jgi:uncharacterized RDD family membrane protein YckC